MRASSSVISQTASNTNHNLIHQNSYSLNMSSSSYNNVQSKAALQTQMNRSLPIWTNQPTKVPSTDYLPHDLNFNFPQSQERQPFNSSLNMNDPLRKIRLMLDRTYDEHDLQKSFNSLGGTYPKMPKKVMERAKLVHSSQTHVN